GASVLLTVCLILFLLAVKSGANAFIRRFFNTCWRTKGICRKSCHKSEIFHVFCDVSILCCIDKKHLPSMVGK
uniref:Beta-defensin n=2 Tax=Bos TaxID=9903 RepID=A0A4W2EP16_BOBOX